MCRGKTRRMASGGLRARASGKSEVPKPQQGGRRKRSSHAANSASATASNGTVTFLAKRCTIKRKGVTDKATNKSVLETSRRKQQWKEICKGKN